MVPPTLSQDSLKNFDANMSNEIKWPTFYELLYRVSFENVFEYMTNTYFPCLSEEDKYRALFDGYKRLCPVESKKEPLEVYLNSAENKEYEDWAAAPYISTEYGSYQPHSWYAFSEKISDLDPEEVLGLKVKCDEEDSYACIVGTMLWDLNWDFHLKPGASNDMKDAEADIWFGNFIEWPAKGAHIVCWDEEMPFILSDDMAKGNIVTNKTQNVLYDKESKQLITNEWFEQIDYTLNPDIYIVYKSEVGNNGSRAILRNLFNVKTGKLELDSWASDIMWLNHLTIFGVLQDGHWNAYDIEKKCYVLKENYDVLRPMEISTCLPVMKSGKRNVVYLPSGEYCLNEWFDVAYAVGETVFVVERDNLYNVFDSRKKTYCFSNWEELVWPTGIMDFFIVKRNGLYNVCNIEDNDDKYIVGLDSISQSNLFDIYIVQRDGKWNLLKLTERAILLDDWYDRITTRKKEPTFFNVIRNGEPGVINVFGKEFMTIEQYKSLNNDELHLTQEVIDKLPIINEEEYTAKEMEADIDSIVDEIMKN